MRSLVARLHKRISRCCTALAVFVVFTGCDDGSESPPEVSSHAKPETPPATAVAERRAVVKLTSSAAAKIREIQEQDGKPFLRVSVVSGGATGFMYDLKFDDQISAANDYVDEADGIRIVVDKRSSLFVEGATIDWQTRPDGRQGFHFDNPNAVK